MLWPVLLFAAVFIGYLCLDAWIIRQRNRRINQMKQRARSAVLAEAERR